MPRNPLKAKYQDVRWFKRFLLKDDAAKERHAALMREFMLRDGVGYCQQQAGWPNENGPGYFISLMVPIELGDEYLRRMTDKTKPKKQS